MSEKYKPFIEDQDPKKVTAFLGNLMSILEKNKTNTNEQTVNEIIQIAALMRLLNDNLYTEYKVSNLPPFLSGGQKIIDALKGDSRAKWEAFIDLTQNELQPRIKTLLGDNIDEFAISKLGLFNNKQSLPLNGISAAQLLGNTGKSGESTDSGEEMKTMPLSL